MAMRSSRLKWMLIAMILFIASGNAHAHAATAHAAAQAEPCATHHHQAAQHSDCCASCINCPSGIILPLEAGIANRAAYTVRLAPDRAAPLTSRFVSPEPGPPRPEPS